MPPRKIKSNRPMLELITEAATNLFSEYGYEGTTVRMIAAKAGVSAGQVTVYFGSKEALYHFIISEIIESGDAVFNPICQEIDRIRSENTMTMEKAWEYIEFFIDRQLETALIPNRHDWLLMVSTRGLSPNANDTKMVSDFLLHKIEIPLALLIMDMKKNIHYLQARTISRAINGAIISFGEHQDLLMDEVINGSKMPDSYFWMKNYLKRFILDGLAALDENHDRESISERGGHVDKI